MADVFRPAAARKAIVAQETTIGYTALAVSGANR
jgi:hypothetical protein